MKRELQERFFSIFRTFGILDTAISIIKKKNDLDYRPQTRPLDDRDFKLIDQQLDSLKNRHNELDDFLNSTELFHALLNEIEDNYLNLPKERDKRGYLLSIITEFKIFSDIIYHDLYYKNTQKDTLISLRENRKAWLKTDNKEEASRQISAIDDYLHEYSEQEKRAKTVSEYFWGFYQMKYDESLIENKIFSHCSYLQHQFSNRFDALCLRYGLDLLKLQTECNVYLLHRHDLSLLQYYLGSPELAEKYLNKVRENELPQEQSGDVDCEKLPKTFEELFKDTYRNHTDRFVDILKDEIKSEHKHDSQNKDIEPILNKKGDWIANNGKYAYIFYHQLSVEGIINKVKVPLLTTLFTDKFKNLPKSFATQGKKANTKLEEEYANNFLTRIKELKLSLLNKKVPN